MALSAKELQAFAFILGIMMAVVFFFRILSPRVVQCFAPDMSGEKQGKCQVYLTELIFSSLAMVFVIGGGGWNPVWTFDFTNESGLFSDSISRGNLAAAWTCAAMYVVELSGEPHMRLSLLAHHFAFISRVLGAVLEISVMPTIYNKGGARMVSCWLWLPTTEQNVFAAMLAYRFRPDLHPKLLSLSAVLYVATRIFGIAVSLVAFGFWISLGIEALAEEPGNELVFVLCVCIQLLGFGVMIWAQWSSATAQWGLAKRQAAKFAQSIKDCEGESSGSDTQ